MRGHQFWSHVVPTSTGAGITDVLRRLVAIPTTHDREANLRIAAALHALDPEHHPRPIDYPAHMETT